MDDFTYVDIFGPPEKPLTPNQEKFCLLYHEKSNATQAYVEAYGIPNRKSATVKAHRLLKTKSIKKRLSQLKNKAAKKSQIKIDELIELNVAIAFSKLSNVIEIIDGEVRFKEDADVDELDSLGFSMSESHNTTEKSESSSKTTSISVKRPDRVKAAQELARLIGAYDQATGETGDKKAAAMKLLDSLTKFKKKEK